MNLLTVISVVLLVLGSTDLVTAKYPRVGRGVFGIAILVTWFLFTIKYYYGPDIWNYVPHYNNIPTVGYILSHPDACKYEIGYEIFCSVLKHAGVSFYWMTVVVSTFYFLCIYLLFRQIKRKQTFALMILVILDLNLIFAAYRQCLSVSCFILLFLAVKDRRYFWAVVMSVLTIVFHKSGFFVVAVTALTYIVVYAVNEDKVPTWVYELLFALLVLVMLLPITKVSGMFLSQLPLPSSYVKSLSHHLSLGRQLQMVFVMYAMVLLALAFFQQHEKTRRTKIEVFVVIGLVITVFLYQYFYLLNRIRSYFLPLVIYYVFTMIQDVEDRRINVAYGKLFTQLAAVVMLVFLGYNVYAFNRSADKLRNKIYVASTVFDLRGSSPKEDIQKRQLRLAYRYWTQDFMSDESNKVQKN